MSRAVDELIGLSFGRLTVVRQVPRAQKGRFFECSCECGNMTVAYSGHLKAGERVSCGCQLADSKRKHGMSFTPEYRTWSRMKERCYNRHNRKYPDYGGRGIEVCERWLNSFEAFFADMGKRPEGLTLDRILNDSGYSPENCRWATYSVQNNNRRPLKARESHVKIS